MVIPSRIIWARFDMVNTIFFTKLSHIHINKGNAIIEENAFGNAKEVDNIIANEVSHSMSPGSLQSYCLDPFGVAFYYSQDPYATWRRWINRTDKIEGPYVKFPGGR